MTLDFPPEVRRDPFPFYAQLRESSPVLREPGTGLWALFDYDSVKRAITDPETFSSAAAPPGSVPAQWLIFTDPPRHSKLRALIGRALTPRSIASLEPRILELTRGLLDPMLTTRGEPDFQAGLSIPLPLMVIADLLGANVAHWPLFRGWSDALLGLVNTISGGPAAARSIAAFSQAHAEMRTYLGGLLEARRARPGNDLLTQLLQAELDGERLGEEELLAFFQLLLLAGHETTTNLIGNALVCLIDNPGELARLQADASLIPGALEEVLRYRSPVQAVFRIARRDVELHGQTIREGALVLALIGSANRDSAHFAEPDRFDVSRSPNPHIAFGHGVHFCIGAALARLEARVVLTELLARVQQFEHAVDSAWEPREAFHVHGPSRLPLRFTLRPVCSEPRQQHGRGEQQCVPDVVEALEGVRRVKLHE